MGRRERGGVGPAEQRDARPVQRPQRSDRLEHYTYCPRQCGLILLEDSFTDDAATVRGTLLQ
ncbi:MULTISPECIES: hypothetical protein [Streptomyces]|uniref:hypothetical protein n=1 Tax=Streptomyces TaxID=1883 RepID=UPI001942F4E4|nr:hypothetical protein [Streptomyces rubradiris]